MTEEFVAFVIREFARAMDDFAFAMERKTGLHKAASEVPTAMAQDLRTATENALAKARVQETKIDEPDLDEPAAFEEPVLPEKSHFERVQDLGREDHRVVPIPEKKKRKANAAIPKETEHIAFVEVWNDFLCQRFHTAPVQKWTQPRAQKLTSRLNEYPNLADLLRQAPINTFVLEHGILTFDWLMQPKNLTKLLEGNYVERELPRRELPKPAKVRSPQELEREFLQNTGIKLEGDDDPGITSILARGESPGGSDLDDPEGNPF